MTGNRGAFDNALIQGRQLIGLSALRSERVNALKRKYKNGIQKNTDADAIDAVDSLQT